MNETQGNDGGSGGGGQSQTQTPATVTTPKTEGNSDNAALEEMYKGGTQIPAEEQQTQEGIQNQEAKPGDSGYVEPVGKDSGYGDGAGDKPATDPAKDEKPAQVDATVVDEKLYEGLEKETADAAKEFITANKLNPEAAKAALDFLKKQSGALETYKAGEAQRIQEARTAQKTQWFNELKTDKEFGGENFNKNLSKAEKVINNHMSGFKNILTTTKGMVPPNVMKDLAKMHDVLYGTEPMVSGGVNGGTGTGNSDEAKFIKDFYK